MSRIFITGSSEGLGLLAAQSLISQGHQVMLHARNPERKKQLLGKVPDAEDVLVADFSSMEETKKLASRANSSGVFDAVIHNAGIYRPSGSNAAGSGWPELLAVNTLAPYILTCLMKKPGRLIYLSSGMHRQGDAALPILPSDNNKTNHVSYPDIKLHDLILALAVARRWDNVYSNAVDPGWVPTKMGGRGAPDSLEEGFATQVWLATCNDPGTKVSGKYFYHKKEQNFLPVAGDASVQDNFLEICAQVTGVKFP